MAKRDNYGNDDDAALWQRVTSQIKPLQSDRYTGSNLTPAPSQQKLSKPKRRIAPSHPSAPDAPNAKQKPIDLSEGDHAGLDGATRRRLAKGALPVESRIDLHGCTAAQAEQRLKTFISGAARIGLRCVLVITGKGTGGEGVLRRHVPVWLKQPPVADHVLAIAPAQPKDGGTGALYVMIRRVRAGK